MRHAGRSSRHHQVNDFIWQALKRCDISATKEPSGLLIFVPVAVETLGPVNAEGLCFLDQIGDRLSAANGDPRESSFLYQKLSVLIQRFNMIAFRGSISETDTDA